MLQGRVVIVERDGVCKLVVQMLHTNAVLRLTAPYDATNHMSQVTSHIKPKQIVCFHVLAYTPPEITVAFSVEGAHAMAPPPSQPRKRTYWSVCDDQGHRAHDLG
jgi:hypothetical protein